MNGMRQREREREGGRGDFIQKDNNNNYYYYGWTLFFAMLYVNRPKIILNRNASSCYVLIKNPMKMNVPFPI